jgi:hypothetical protein
MRTKGHMDSSCGASTRVEVIKRRLQGTKGWQLKHNTVVDFAGAFSSEGSRKPVSHPTWRWLMRVELAVDAVLGEYVLLAILEQILGPRLHAPELSINNMRHTSMKINGL